MDISQVSLSGIGHQRLFIPLVSATIICLKYEECNETNQFQKSLKCFAFQHDSYVYCCQYFKSRLTEVQKQRTQCLILGQIGEVNGKIRGLVLTGHVRNSEELPAKTLTQKFTSVLN